MTPHAKFYVNLTKGGFSAKSRWYYSAVHWHSQCDVGNITFCNFCCFRCASP